jgi:glycine cleavage system aminomethyltransferase T
MGQVQKKLTLWKFDGDQVPTAGMELRSGEKVVATVTSGTFCFGHEAPLALCLARRTHFDVGSRAASPIGEAEVIG